MFFNKKKNIEKLKIVEAEEKKRKEEEEFDEEDDDEFDMESPILDLDIEPEDIDFSKVFAYHSFVSSQSGQVCVIKDEELVLLDDSNDYWWLVRCCRSNEIGYIPADNVETPIERLARVNRRKNLEILVPDDVPIIKTNYAQKKVTFSKQLKIEMTEAVDDSDDDNDCKIHRVNTGSYKGKKKKSIFSKLLGKKDKKSKKDNYYNETIEPYSTYSDIMEDEEINSPAVMINDPNVIMRIGNVPDEEDDDSDTPPSRLDSLNILNGSSELNNGNIRPNDFNDGFIEQNGLDKFIEPVKSIEPNGLNEINKSNDINKSNEINKSDEINKPNENNNLNVYNEPNEYNESYNESNESFDKPIEYDNESDEYDRPIEYDNEPDGEYDERNHFSYDRNEILNPGEIVIKVYAGNIELKTSFKSIKIEEDMTARDVLLIAMEKFRIPKNTVDEYYIGVIHFESQEKPVKPDANIMNVIRKLNSKGLPGITVSSRSSLINDTINLLDNRFIKFFLNRKIEEQEKEFKLIRVFIEERDNNNHQIYKTIGVLEHEKVVDVINNALTKFSIYQDKNPYDFTLISLFKHQKIPRDYDDSIYDIIKEVTKNKRRSYDIDFLLKPNKPVTPMNQSNAQNDNSFLQQQLKNAGNSEKPIKPLPENFKPPARTSSSSAKSVPKRTSSKISEKSERSGIISPNYQSSSITSPLKEESLLLSFSPPPQLPLYLPFTDARYDSDNSSNPPRFDSNGQDDTIDEDDVSFEDPPRSNSLIPMAINSLSRSNEQSNVDTKVETNEKTEMNRNVDSIEDNNKNNFGILNDERIVSIKQRENPPRKSSLDYREENDENSSRVNNFRQKREDNIRKNSLKDEEGQRDEEEIKTSIDRNNLFNIKSSKQSRASFYSDVDESETNSINNNEETTKNMSRNDSEKLKINIGKKERNEKNEKLNELSDELDDINELVKQLESEVSPISINSSINNDVTKLKTDNLNDTKSPKDMDNGNEAKVNRNNGPQKSPLKFTPRVSSVTSPRAIKNKIKLQNHPKSGNRERSKSIDQQRPEIRERSKSIDQQRPEIRERSKSIDQQRPEIRERSKSIDQQRPETRERSKSIDQQHPETHEGSKSIDQQSPEVPERSKSIEQQSPLTPERSKSIEQQIPETPERSKSIEQQSPLTPERSKSIEQQIPETPERSKSIEQQPPLTPERSKSIEQQSPLTPERSKSIEQQIPETPERSKSIEQQSPETPERSKSIEQQLSENPKRSESIEQKSPESPKRSESIEQHPEFPEKTKSNGQQSSEEPERYKSVEQQRLESPVKSKYEQPQRLESPVRSKSVEQQQYRLESPVRSKSVEQSQRRLENPIRNKSNEQHRLENPVRTKSIDQQRLESPIRSRSVEQHHLETPVRSKSIEQQRLESPIRSKSVDQPRPLRSKSIDQQYSEDPASLEINLSIRSVDDERRARRYQRPARDYDRMDDRSVVSSTVGSVMTDSSREIISDRGVMRDSEGRLLNNDRRRMKPRKPSASPIRENERRMRQRRHSPGRDGERSMEGENMFMSPDMRERYGRPRGPEDNIPPHMRDRRPRGPEDDIPPHMRDRRPRGPEDDIPPHMRERRPRGAERTPRMGERTPRMGERTPRMGERTPRMGERTPRMGERTPKMGERTPRMGERTPRMGERTPRMSERKPKDPRMSRSCSPNRRRPRAPGETSSPALSSISLRNSPRPPMTAGIELPGKHSSLGRDAGMNKPVSPLHRNQDSNTDSSKPYLPERPIRKNSLNKDHCLVSVERKISNNSGKFGNGIDDSLIDTIAKTPLIVNEVEEVKLQSVEIMNENGEVVNKNSIKSPNSSHVIDFNELLNTLDTTLQNNNISGHSTGISPTRRKNSDDLERIRNIRKSRFEDMEKSLDSSIQKTRANDSTQMKSNHHDSNNIGDNLNNLLKELNSPSPSYGPMNLSGLWRY